MDLGGVGMGWRIMMFSSYRVIIGGFLVAGIVSHVRWFWLESLQFVGKEMEICALDKGISSCILFA